MRVTKLVSLLLWHCACTLALEKAGCLVASLCVVDLKQDWLSGLE